MNNSTRARQIRRQCGFSLAEILVALLLFALVITALLGYHQQITAASQRQWHYRQIWRLTSQQTELSPPPLPAGFTLTREEARLMDCRLITVTVTSRDGLQGSLTRLHCPR